MGRDNRHHRLRQRRLRREKHLQVLLQPLSGPSIHAVSTTKCVSSTICSTEYLVSYCYKNWREWRTRVQSELTRRQAETERPYTQRDETKIANLQRFADMMGQVQYMTVQLDQFENSNICTNHIPSQICQSKHISSCDLGIEGFQCRHNRSI